MVWKKMMGFQNVPPFNYGYFPYQSGFKYGVFLGITSWKLRVNPVTRLGTLQQGEGRFGVVPAGLICQTRNGPPRLGENKMEEIWILVDTMGVKKYST